jgi:glucosamine--fructose-6-phosphate aminotransferase (isomerizing)
MFREAAQAGQAVATQIARTRDVLEALAASIAASPPSMFLTCARGSSDHAATFLRYLFETHTGVITSSFSPSVLSVYGQAPSIGNGICTIISQSGRSSDLLAVAERYRANGNRVLAIVNDMGSPLAEIADFTFPICAGAETSVAATKSFIATLSAILLVANRQKASSVRLEHIEKLPQLLDASWKQDWTDFSGAIAESRGLFIIGRGLGLGIANEAALKFKETSGLHAEAFSAAEVRHGPMALLASGLPVLIFRQSDEAAKSVDDFARFALAQGNKVFIVGQEIPGAVSLPSAPSVPFIEPLLQIQAFYRAANDVAIARGLNPDMPPMLKKVTETL